MVQVSLDAVLEAVKHGPDGQTGLGHPEGTFERQERFVQYFDANVCRTAAPILLARRHTLTSRPRLGALKSQLADPWGSI